MVNSSLILLQIHSKHSTSILVSKISSANHYSFRIKNALLFSNEKKNILQDEFQLASYTVRFHQKLENTILSISHYQLHSHFHGVDQVHIECTCCANKFCRTGVPNPCPADRQRAGIPNSREQSLLPKLKNTNHNIICTGVVLI